LVEHIILKWPFLSIYTEQEAEILMYNEQSQLASFSTIEYNPIKDSTVVFHREEMADTNPHHARAIGEKLRTVRQERKMSLRDLANKADVSASMLSQIETGKVFPSVRSLYSIANALEVSIDYFFPEGNEGRASVPPNGAEPQEHSALTASEMRDATLTGATALQKDFVPPSGASAPIVSANSRPMIELKGGVTWARLTALAERGAEFLEITYAPGAMSGANLSHHEGREFGLVLEGELLIELGFESYALQKGDSIIFESTVPHRLINRSNQPMRAVWVVLSPGQ
jgi:transcriptional regulator with XRE-family HTH domain/mannose-6-phosphate isomerase-like protein (cupin superfamily)